MIASRPISQKYARKGTTDLHIHSQITDLHTHVQLHVTPLKLHNLNKAKFEMMDDP